MLALPNHYQCLAHGEAEKTKNRGDAMHHPGVYMRAIYIPAITRSLTIACTRGKTCSANARGRTHQN